MAEKIYNLDKVVSVKIYDKSLYFYLDYVKPKTKGFFKHGGYFKHVFAVGDNKYYSEKDIISGKYNDTEYLVINNTVYEKPYVKITFVNNEKIIFVFNTYEDALEWGRGQANIAIHLDKQFFSN